MAYSMQDIIPWSLIYSAQNDKHEAEIVKKNEELNIEKERTRQLARVIIRNLLGSCTHSFNYIKSDVWQDFMSVKDIISDVDIDITRIAILKIIDKSYGMFSQHTHDEIDLKANYCKEVLRSIKPS